LKEKNLKNVGASVRRRLLNLARQETRPFQELLQYYAMERFLFRMSVSPYADLFVLKGAMWSCKGKMDGLRSQRPRLIIIA